MKNNSQDWIGKRFGRLTVIGFSHNEKPLRGWSWLCECDCGVKKILSPSEVKSGKIKSCGCLHDELCRSRAKKFKYSVHEYKRLYSIYNGVKKRCYREEEPRYKDYGGRNITVCDEWLNPNTGFDSFVEWSLSHGYADNLTLDRVDVEKGYSPNNCRWITLQSQNRNKRDSLYVEYKGEKVLLIDLCEKLELSYDTVHNRIYSLGWTVEKAITAPSQQESSLRAKCRKHGIAYETVRSRINKLGWDEERALTTPVKTK